MHGMHKFERTALHGQTVLATGCTATGSSTAPELALMQRSSTPLRPHRITGRRRGRAQLPRAQSRTPGRRWRAACSGPWHAGSSLCPPGRAWRARTRCWRSTPRSIPPSAAPRQRGRWRRRASLCSGSMCSSWPRWVGTDRAHYRCAPGAWGGLAAAAAAAMGRALLRSRARHRLGRCHSPPGPSNAVPHTCCCRGRACERACVRRTTSPGLS
jgi:hypothetical protein